MSRPTAVLALLLASVSGCGGIQIEPFTLFTQTTIELRDGTDQALQIQYEWARERYADLVATSDNDSLTAVLLRGLLLDSSQERPYDWVAPEGSPPFVTVFYFQESIRRMNEAIVRYAWLLEQLAASGTLTREDFDRMADEIDGALLDATGALRLPAPERRITLFSETSTLLFHQYLDAKSKQKLHEALVANQHTIEAASTRLREGLALAARHLHHEYQERSFDLATALAPEHEATPSTKRKRVEELLLLNDLYRHRLRTLRTLDESYRLLPRANQSLHESLGGGEKHWPAIREISDHAGFLRADRSSHKRGGVSK